MSWLDRFFCWLVGHSATQRIFNSDGMRCVHCELEISSIQLIALWRRRTTPTELATDCLSYGFPKRVTRHEVRNLWR